MIATRAIFELQRSVKTAARTDWRKRSVAGSSRARGDKSAAREAPGSRTEPIPPLAVGSTDKDFELCVRPRTRPSTNSTADRSDREPTQSAVRFFSPNVPKLRRREGALKSLVRSSRDVCGDTSGCPVRGLEGPSAKWVRQEISVDLSGRFERRASAGDLGGLP